MTILELKNIRKSYFLGKEEFPVLKGINLSVERGDFVSLLGESGGGKSTLMNIIGGLDREYQGDVLVDGVAQKSRKEKDMDAYRRETIGFIFQSFNLVSYLSVLDNILMSLKMTRLSEKERHQRALELTKQVGLYEHRKKKPSQLSGGQKQRVAIARALASDPEIILADEPTGALDSQNTAEVLTILRKIAQSGKTVIVVTHSQEVANYGTRIIHLADGVITGDERIKPAYPLEGEPTRVAAKALSFGDIFRTSFKHFTNAWKINLLIAIGTAIGLFSVIFFLGLGNGGTQYMNKMITNVANPNLIGATLRGADNQAKNNDEAYSNAMQSPTPAYFNDGQARTLKNIDHVKSVDLIYTTGGKATVTDQNINAELLSNWTKAYPSSSLRAGKAPKDDEIVIDEALFKALDSKAYENKKWKSMIGKEISLQFALSSAPDAQLITRTFKVSGVMDSSTFSVGPGGQYISTSTLKKIFQENNATLQTSNAFILADKPQNVRQVVKDIQKVKTDGKRVFATQDVGTILTTVNNITGIVTTVLAAVAGISLVVSIFMIVVTTYMSVAERTKEIGIIRAMGGRRKDISRLFTSESLILGLSAAILAIVLAFIGQAAINSGLHSLVGGNLVVITGGHVISIVIVAVVIAMLSSLAPAVRAAHLNTIEALATE
ncbi:ABC transporter ATP-binding protein/permease [Lactovum odontotermitis]